jgi:hypothetical protein
MKILVIPNRKIDCTCFACDCVATMYVQSFFVDSHIGLICMSVVASRETFFYTHSCLIIIGCKVWLYCFGWLHFFQAVVRVQKNEKGYSLLLGSLLMILSWCTKWLHKMCVLAHKVVAVVLSCTVSVVVLVLSSTSSWNNIGWYCLWMYSWIRACSIWQERVFPRLGARL